MEDFKQGDPIKFDAVYQFDSGVNQYTREKCKQPMNGSFHSETKLGMDGADITVAAITFGVTEILVPMDAVTRRP